MCFFLLETVQRTRWGNAGHAGSIHSAELDFRDVESDGGGLQPGLHHLQRTGQNGSDCPPTSRRKWVISQGRTTKSGGRGKKEIRGDKTIAVSLLQSSHFGWRRCSRGLDASSLLCHVEFKALTYFPAMSANISVTCLAHVVSCGTPASAKAGLQGNHSCNCKPFRPIEPAARLNLLFFLNHLVILIVPHCCNTIQHSFQL